MGFSKFGQIYYPVKTNDHPSVIREVMDLEGNFEVDGYLHIKTLLEMGVLPSRILYSIPVRKESHLIEAVSLGIDRFTIDSEQDVGRPQCRSNNFLVLENIPACIR